jgi:replicative DNA helicase Mcm
MKMQKSVSDAVLNRTQDEDFATDIFFERIVEIHNLDLLSTTENTIINDPSKYLTKKDEQDILRFRKNYSDDTQLMNILVNSFAPHIYGHEEIKQSILLQNVGAIEIDREDFKTRKRIHILLVGDPGTYKSQLLTAAMKLSINGHMASGKGITGVGITASVERDGKGIARVRIGKAVYANKGHVSLDEFLQVKQDDQGYLLDILESGIFRVDKAGINVMLNADASYLVATNPDNGRYNAHNSLFDNLTISPQMFSRFHMVWVLLDIVNQKEDRKKALHIMSSFDQTVVQKNKDYKKEEWDKIRISNDLLFKYLLYAQTHNTSDITIEQAAMDIFLEYYSKIRTPEKSSDITATGRQFVGILMFAYARCRLMLRDIVTEKDAEETVNLLNKSYKSCGILIEGTGGLNLTMKFGKPLYEIKDKKQCFTRAVEDLTVNPETREVTPVTKSTIVDALIVDARWLKSEAEEFFDKMYDANKMLRNTVGEYQLTNS